MRYVKWAFWGLFWLLFFAFFHYTLPQHDIARITDTYEKRIDPGDNWLFWSRPDVGTNETLQNRDVFFIQARKANGKVMVYRNEDTGWGWPPYFKFDTSNLQAEAADLKSTPETPKWVSVTHYGWRNEFMSIFPNAVGVKEVAGPDVRIIPWINIILLTILAALFWAIRVRWLRFKRRRIDPLVEDVGDSWDAAGDNLSEKRGRLSRWLGSWRK
ncbi:DUF1523 family protein [Pseudooceanicola sp.]|uniref:DUF1523 family protein n=1 Tax=Pseudooceanicola sp. TaxID=1914328 RepID=UPI0026367C27|nr:DUF1523 family protein [Pseudooceanicola sp.]MDF1856268.1 DUF1523 family protein [Pseudooceanicola sp.]